MQHILIVLVDMAGDVQVQIHGPFPNFEQAHNTGQASALSMALGIVQALEVDHEQVRIICWAGPMESISVETVMLLDATGNWPGSWPGREVARWQGESLTDLEHSDGEAMLQDLLLAIEQGGEE
ncbi:MAG: hypothetical protein GY772_28920 [bacterium]|nr:hypothetical protein [bacterium]